MTVSDDDERISDRPPAWVRLVGRTSWAFLGLAGAIAVVIFVLGSLRDLVIPLLVASFLAVVFAPIVDWLHAHRVPRAVGALIVILLVFAVFAVTIGIVVVGVVDRSDELSEAFDDSREQIVDAVDRWNLDGVVDSIRDQADESGGLIQGGLGQQVGSALGSAVGFASGLVLGVVLLYYLLKDGSSLVRSTIAQRSHTRASQAERIVTQAAKSIRGYVRGRSILALAQAVTVTAALWLLDVPLAGSVGVVNFIGAYIPYFGAFVGGLFAVLMGLAGGGTGLALLALVVVLFVNLVLENLLEPHFVGSTLQLHPVVVLISTVAGGLLIGIVGLVLGAPTVAIGLNLGRELRESGFFTDDAGPTVRSQDPTEDTSRPISVTDHEQTGRNKPPDPR